MSKSDSRTTAKAATEDGVAVVFPGQGSQSLGMAGKVIRVHPPARDRFTEASDVLGYDLLDLIEHGPLGDLNDTGHSQPAILTASVAWYDALRASWGRTGRPLQPVALAGHSMGQITAAVAAGALDFADGVRLVRDRATIMREANRERPGGMASIIGLRDRVVRALLGEASTHGTIVMATDNGPGHTVVSGDESALQRIMHLAEEQGARRVIRLPISIASHSPLMESAQRPFRDVVDSMAWHDPEVPIISNLTAGFLLTKEALVEELHEALCRPVRWADSVKTMSARGANLFVEAGPGDVLTKLVRRISHSAWTFPLSDDDAGLVRRDYPDKSDGIPK